MDVSARALRRWRAPLDLLSGVLPGIDESDYLMACLGPRDRAIAAWQRWRGRHPATVGLSHGNEELRGLASLLAANLLACGVTLDAPDAAWLRAARLYEQRRSERYRSVLAEVLGALASRRVRFLLARGAAVSETVLSEPWLRHGHDIDLLAAPDQEDAAARALAAAGLVERPAPPAGRRFVHAGGLPVCVHTRPIAFPLVGPSVEEMAERGQDATVLGTRVRVQAADDLLLHVCAHAVASVSRRSGRWVCDAHEIVVNRPLLAWDRLRTTALRSGLAAPLAVTLGYLRDAVGTPVREDVLDSLAAASARATRRERDGLVHAARLGGDGGWWALWAAAGARSRLTLLRWALAPDPIYLQSIEPGSQRSLAQLQLRRFRRGWRELGRPRATA